jgi:glycosidase
MLCQFRVQFVEHISHANPEARHNLAAVKRLLRRHLCDEIALVDRGVGGFRVDVPG